MKKAVLGLLVIAILTTGCALNRGYYERHCGTKTFGDVIEFHLRGNKEYMVVHFDFIVPIGYSIDSRKVDFYRTFECEENGYPCKYFRIGDRAAVSNFDGEIHKDPIRYEIKRLRAGDQEFIYLERHAW